MAAIKSGAKWLLRLGAFVCLALSIITYYPPEAITFIPAPWLTGLLIGALAFGGVGSILYSRHGQSIWSKLDSIYLWIGLVSLGLSYLLFTKHEWLVFGDRGLVQACFLLSLMFGGISWSIITLMPFWHPDDGHRKKRTH